MIDPKYASLPGIDTCQPDVFETSDLPEADQPAQAPPDSVDSEQVETIQVDVKDVYGRFKDKRLDASKVDFSDGVSSRGGYESSGHFQINLDRADETLEMRFKRLQMEMQELSEDLERAEKTATDDAKVAKISPALLNKNVTDLQIQLHTLQLHKNFGGSMVNLGDPKGNIQQKLLSQIEQLKISGTQKVTKPGKPSESIYELYSAPSNSASLRMATLEQRIAKLESVLGPQAEKVALLEADNKSDGLLQAIDDLQTKVNLLNPKIVDQVDGRLGALQLRLQQISEKKSSGNGVTQETANQIKEIHEKVIKWESVCSSLPAINDRLISLSDLHEKSISFASNIQQLEAMQKTISGNLFTQSIQVGKVEATLAGNLETIVENCKSLDERITNLKK